jgi:hypothetical protein
MAMTTTDLVLGSFALEEAARGACTEPKPEANPAYQSGGANADARGSYR